MALQFSSSHGKILRSSKLRAVIFSRQIFERTKIYLCNLFTRNHANSVTDCSNVYYSKTFTVLIFNSAFDFFGFDIILLLITIFTFKWCTEISFESYHGSMILTNLSQLSSESLSVKYTQKVYWSVWKHTVDKLDNYIHSNELWESRSLCTEKSVGCITGPFH